MRLKVLLGGPGEDGLTESRDVCPVAAQSELLALPPAKLCSAKRLGVVTRIRAKN